MVTTIRFPDELHKLLKDEAEKKGLTFNAYLISLLWDIAGRDGRNDVCAGQGM